MSTYSPFLAFATDSADIEALKTFAETHGWAESCIQQGDIKTAATYLKDHPSPGLLLVEIPSEKEAPALLDGLAEVCDPDTKVVVTGTVNQFSFYRWLMDLGIVDYVLRPLHEANLESMYAKSLGGGGPGGKADKMPGKLISVLGSRGGVGASTLCINLAGIISGLSKKSVALVDMDPQEGSIALMMDIEPCHGFREALEKPDRVDQLFVERIMIKASKNLAILSSEEAMHLSIQVHEDAAETLITELRRQYDVVILDIPRHLDHFTTDCLKQSDQVVMVTEFSLPGLRDTLRHGDVMRDAYKMTPPVLVANRAGMTKKHEIAQSDFEKGAGGKIAYKISYAPDVFMPVSSEIAALKNSKHAAVKPLYALAEKLVPEATLKNQPAEKKGLFKSKKNTAKES